MAPVPTAAVRIASEVNGLVHMRYRSARRGEACLARAGISRHGGRGRGVPRPYGSKFREGGCPV